MKDALSSSPLGVTRHHQSSFWPAPIAMRSGASIACGKILAAPADTLYHPATGSDNWGDTEGDPYRYEARRNVWRCNPQKALRWHTGCSKRNPTTTRLKTSSATSGQSGTALRTTSHSSTCDPSRRGTACSITTQGQRRLLSV